MATKSRNNTNGRDSTLKPVSKISGQRFIWLQAIVSLDTACQS